MKQLIVNGKFLAQRLTGVQRFSLEVLRELSFYDDLQIKVAMPKDASIPEGDFPNCTFVKVGKLKNNFWEQWSLPRYCKKEKAPLLCMGDNAAPALYKSYVTIHDVIFKEKNDGKYGKLWGLKSRLLVRSFIYKSKKIFTVSEFSKSRLMYFYPKIKPPVVVYNGFEQILRVDESPVDGVTGEYYFSVGSGAPSKNFIYILYLAKNNPDKNFIVTGKMNPSQEKFINENNLKNCKFIGYMSDSQLLWLYKNCKGFILPSVYEGFGVPPLEALACGCRQIFLSDIQVFKELYPDCATFFDPLNYEQTVDLSNVKTVDEETVKNLLKKYSFRNTAEIIYREIFD